VPPGTGLGNTELDDALGWECVEFTTYFRFFFLPLFNQDNLSEIKNLFHWSVLAKNEQQLQSQTYKSRQEV